MAPCGIGLTIGQIRIQSSEGIVVESGVQTGQHPLREVGALIGDGRIKNRKPIRLMAKSSQKRAS
jgi:hypothetical protein